MVALFSTWAILIVFSIILYKYGKKDLTNPAFFLGLSFFLSFTIVIYNIRNWDIETHGYIWDTSFCIFAALISFTLGGTFISRVSSRNNVNNKNVHWQIKRRSGNYPYMIFSILSTILFVLFLSNNLKGFSWSSFSNFTETLRDNYISGKQYGFFKSQILEVLVGLAYISFHRVLIEKFYLKRKVNKSLFIPVILFLFCTLLNTDRNIFLRFMIFGLVSSVMSSNWTGITTKKNREIMIRVGIAILLIAVLFWLYGYLKKYTSNFERMIGIYGGSGLYGFNLWLKDFNNHFTYGEFTFASLLNTLRSLGIGSGVTQTQHFQLIAYRSQNGYVFATNIFSALRVYYQDFGITGVIIISFALGMLFERIYQAAVRRKYGYWWLFYCAHLYHILYFPIQEQFFLRFHLGLVYEIFWLSFFYYIVYGKKGLWRIKH